MSLGPPILTGLNNGILTGNVAMPTKDITSDGNSSFSMSRRIYRRLMPLTVQSNAIQQDKSSRYRHIKYIQIRVLISIEHRD